MLTGRRRKRWGQLAKRNMLYKQFTPLSNATATPDQWDYDPFLESIIDEVVERGIMTREEAEKFAESWY